MAKGAKLPPFIRLLRLLALDKREIRYIYIFAIFSGIVSLSLPLGIQAILGLIMGAQVSTSWVFLVIIVSIGSALGGIFQILQMGVSEIIQQRLFARASFEFASRMPRLKFSERINYHPPELVNRFFDIITVQKGLPKILKDVSTASVQAIFCLVLLSFYHSFFVFFGFILLIYLFVIFYFSGPKGLETSIKESGYKYKVVYWLEEIARTMTSFKLKGNSTLEISKLDPLTQGYITARKAHFRVLIFQFGNLVAFKTLITAGLLLIGGLLVIEQEISIGQFVAAEIIIIILLNAIEKLIMSVETIYDVLTSLDKLGVVTDLPLERQSGISLLDAQDKLEKGIEFEIEDLTIQNIAANYNDLENINIKINAGEKVCLLGSYEYSKYAICKVLLGLSFEKSVNVAINSLPLTGLDLGIYRSQVGTNLFEEEIFAGSIKDNILLGKNEISMDILIEKADICGLTDFIKRIPEAYDFELFPQDIRLPQTIKNRILLCRAIVHNPKALLIKDNFYSMSKKEREKALNYLTQKPATTLIAITNNQRFVKMCSRAIVLDRGRIVFDGSTEELFQTDVYNNYLSIQRDDA